MVLLDTCAQVTIALIACIQPIGFGQDSEWGKEANTIDFCGLDPSIECIVVGTSAEYIIDLGVLHACSVNAHKVQHVRYL